MFIADVEAGKVIPKLVVEDKENVPSTANVSAATDNVTLKATNPQDSATQNATMDTA